MKIARINQNSSSLLLAVLVLLFLETSQRKSFLVKEQHSPLLAPTVRTYDTTATLFSIDGYTMSVGNQI